MTQKIASSTICTQQLFISGFSKISPSNGKLGWNILGELVKQVVVVVVLGFYVPPTAKVIRRQDLSLKSHPKDCKTG